MKIKIALTDGRADKRALTRLSLHGFHIIPLPRHPALSEAVCAHTDMLLARLGDEIITTADYAEVSENELTELWNLTRGGSIRIKCTSDTLSVTYPDDCRLNALRIGGCIYLREASASKYLIDKAKAEGLKIINVKQGYPACTVLKLSETACITADRGMARALQTSGINVTLIEQGHIDLPPHEYGFIGGCGGVCDGSLYLMGDPTTHPSYDIIRKACEREGLTIVNLCGGRLRDVGGILFVDGDI